MYPVFHTFKRIPVSQSERDMSRSSIPLSASDSLLSRINVLCTHVKLSLASLLIIIMILLSVKKDKQKKPTYCFSCIPYGMLAITVCGLSLTNNRSQEKVDNQLDANLYSNQLFCIYFKGEICLLSHVLLLLIKALSY